MHVGYALAVVMGMHSGYAPGAKLRTAMGGIFGKPSRWNHWA